MKRFEEVLHRGKFFEKPKQFQQKDADRIIGPAPEGVFVSHESSYKRKIDERGNETGKATGNTPIRMDLNVTRFKGVSGQPKFLGLRKWAMMLVMDLNANTIEFLDGIANGKWRQISQSLARPK